MANNTRTPWGTVPTISVEPIYAKIAKIASSIYPSFYKPLNMPTPRRPLGVIDGNIKKRQELTPYKRGQLVGARIAGAKLTDIIDVFDILKSTVKYTLRHDPVRNDGASKPRSGAPKQYTDRDERVILRFIRKNLKTKYATIKREYRLEISYTTIKRILRRNSITS